ncbi:MAG TPA: trigger factor [Steroidobacteraceae bacterium]|nr:trigger factor [Steroidobacteraceae bacterium]
MQVSVTATGLERRLEVAVPADDVQREVDQRLRRLSRTARLKGFRPGKAPIAIVRQQFGDQVHAEVVSELMRSSLAEAVSQEHLRPATGPRIEPIDLAPGADLKYAAIFEVMPEIKLRPLDSIAIERPTASVAESDIDAMIESMRRQRPLYTEVERPARPTDRVTVDYDGRIDGQPFEGSEGRDAAFVLGSGRLLAELDAAVTGAAPGESRAATVRYPDTHANKSLAGRTAEFTVRVKKVEEQSLPPIDEEFCRAFGVEEGGIDALRAEVRKSMEHELGEVVRNRLRSQVLDTLYRDNPLEVPRALVAEAIERLQVETAQRMGARDLSQLPPREAFEEPARRRVALGAILGEIVRAEGVQVDRSKVEARLEAVAANYPKPEEARRAYLQSPEAMRQLESAVIEDQALDAVLARAKVTERPATFRELTGFGSAESSSETPP